MSELKIPKIVHYCWLSGDPFPEKIQSCINSWKKNLLDYEFWLWDTNRFKIEDNKWVQQTFEQKKYAFAADYIRLYAVYNFGGIYLDCDVEVLKPFDDLLNSPYFAGTEGNGIIEAGVFGARKGEPWLKVCLDYYKGKSFISDNGEFNTRPLPSIIMSQINGIYQPKIVSKDEFLNRVTTYHTDKVLLMLNKEFLCAKDMGTGKLLNTTETYCIHHFAMSWIPKNKVFLSDFKRFLMKLFGIKNIEIIIKLFKLKELRKLISC